MKHLVICTVVLLFALSASAQLIDQKSTMTAEKYMDKSKKQRKVGRILLGAGAGLIIVDAVITKGELVKEGIPWLENLDPDEHKNDGVKAVFMSAGVASALASIPFFIISKKNSRRANSMGFKVEKSKNIIGLKSYSIPFPALAFKVNF